MNFPRLTEVETGRLNAYDSNSCLLSTSELVDRLVDYVEEFAWLVESICRIVFDEPYNNQR